MPRKTYLVAILAIGILLRFLSARGDLWLDEIWSLNLISKAPSASSLFALHHDNNHLLNSLWLYLLGPGQSFFLYRLFAVVCSCAALIALGYLLNRMVGRVQAVLFALFISLSYVMVLYGSEARGYAPLFLALAINLGAHATYRQTSSRLSRVLFWVSAWLGIVSHLSFLQVYLSLLLADFLTSLRRVGIARIGALHLPAACGVLGFALYFIADMKIGGGPIHSLWDTFFSLFSIGFGGEELSALAPQRGALYLALSLALSLALYILACVESVRLLRTNRATGVVLLSLLVLVPIGSIVVLQPRFISVRYLLPTLLAGYFAIASLLTRLWQQQGSGKLIAAAVTAIFLLGNLHHTFRLLQDGRGNYSAAVGMLIHENQDLSVGTWQTFRTRTVVEFYTARVTGDLRPVLTIVPLADQSARYTWAITTADDKPPPHPQCWQFADYPSAPLSGFTWTLWRCG